MSDIIQVSLENPFLPYDKVIEQFRNPHQDLPHAMVDLFFGVQKYPMVIGVKK